MKVERVTNDPKYPYPIRITLPRYLGNMINRQDFAEWVKVTDFSCCLVPYAVYVKKESDAMLFILRWS